MQQLSRALQPSVKFRKVVNSYHLPKPLGLSLFLHQQRPAHGVKTQKRLSNKNTFLQSLHLNTTPLSSCRAPVKCQAMLNQNSSRRSLLGWILKHVVIWLGSAAAILSVFLAALPALISTSFGLGCTTMAVNIFMPGIVEVQKVSLGWNRPIHVEGIVVKDGIKKLVPVLEIAKLSTSRTLWDIANGPVVNAFPDETGNIPVVKYAQKAGLLMKTEKRAVNTGAQSKSSSQQSSSEEGTKKRAVVRTKHFEEWITNTAKNTKKEPRLMQRSYVQSHVKMTAEIRSKGRSVLVNDGKVLVTKEVRSLMGEFVHLIVAEGQEDVKSISEDLPLGTEWMVQGGRLKLGEIVPVGDPLLIHVDSPNITSEIRGWNVDRAIKMQRPGKFLVTLTPAFSREVLARLNPLLTNMVAMKSGTKVQMEISTKDRMLPSNVVNLHFEPIQLTAGSAPFWDSLLNLLRVRERGLVPGQPLQVWTSPIDCSILDNEIARCQRCDMLLGPANKGVHVVVWGECSLETEKIKMWLGIPADTLQRIGYKNLKSDYVLPVPLQGTVDNPRVDWEGASDEISKLAFMHLMGNIGDEDDAEGFEGYWKTKLLNAAKRTERNEKTGSECVVPPSSYPLPWESTNNNTTTPKNTSSSSLSSKK